MRLLPLLVLLAPWPALVRSAGPSEESVFAPKAVLKVEAEGGVGGEGPAWDSKRGLFSSGNDNVNRLDRRGKVHVFRKGAGTNRLLFDRQARLLACEPNLRPV